MGMRFVGPVIAVLCVQSAACSQCSGYTPSELERTWVATWHEWEHQELNPNMTQLCQHHRPVRWPEDASEFVCNGVRIPIEPLVGLLRTPDYPAPFHHSQAW